jgi:hypothetical protein
VPSDATREDGTLVPFSPSYVKPHTPQFDAPATSADGHIERVVKTIQLGPFRRILVSHVVVPSGRPYASIRVFLSADGEAFAPTKAGVMLQLGIVDDVVNALIAARDMGSAR